MRPFLPSTFLEQSFYILRQTLFRGAERVVYLRRLGGLCDVGFCLWPLPSPPRPSSSHRCAPILIRALKIAKEGEAGRWYDIVPPAGMRHLYVDFLLHVPSDRPYPFVI